jgi:hypothetical protein
VSGATSTSFTVVPGPATQLVFTTEPPTTPNPVAGQSIAGPVAVSVEDAEGNVVTTASGSVTLGLATSPVGATVANGSAVPLVSGVATFPSLSLNLAGTYTLSATTDLSGVSAATSTSFSVVAGAASTLVFTTEPATTPNPVAGQSVGGPVTVSVEDPEGNVVTTASGSVTLSEATGPTGATVSNGSAPFVSGVATFSSLSLNLAGTYTLSAATGLSGVSGATSTSFTVVPGQFTLSQASGVPIDVLGSALCSGGIVPGITLNGGVQTACGALSPLTITNASGSNAGWTLTGQVSDFIDPANPTLTCDTTATYSNHCIPGGDMGWIPQASVVMSLSGTATSVVSGTLVAPSTLFAAGSVVSPPQGLHATPQVLCEAPATQSQGQFSCGAGFVLPVPSSAAVTKSPGFEATLTLTLF